MVRNAIATASAFVLAIALSLPAQAAPAAEPTASKTVLSQLDLKSLLRAAAEEAAPIQLAGGPIPFRSWPAYGAYRYQSSYQFPYPGPISYYQYPTYSGGYQYGYAPTYQYGVTMPYYYYGYGQRYRSFYPSY
jgi:hypothetical protein